MRLVWSSRSQKFTGHAMTHEELTTLCDVYQTLKSDFRQKQTSYVLQTLWRDLTSEVCWAMNVHLHVHVFSVDSAFVIILYLLYTREVWWGIKFVGLPLQLSVAKLNSHQYFQLYSKLLYYIETTRLILSDPTTLVTKVWITSFFSQHWWMPFLSFIHVGLKLVQSYVMEHLRTWQWWRSCVVLSGRLTGI